MGNSRDTISVELYQRWYDLTRVNKKSHIFNHPAWTSEWFKVYGDKIETKVIDVSEGDKLKAVGAFRLDKENFYGFPFKVTKPILQEMVDYTDVLCDSENETRNLIALIKKTQSSIKSDVIYFKDLKFDSLLLKNINELEKQGFSIYIEEGNLCPHLEIDKEYVDYAKSQFNKPSNKRRLITKLTENERVEIFNESDLDKLPLSEMIDVENNSWKGEAGTGLFSNKEKTDYYSSVFKEYHKNKDFQLLGVKLDGALVGYILGFYHNNEWGFFSTAQCCKETKLSVGTALLLMTVKNCFEMKLSGVDFLRGAEKTKFDLTSNARQNYDMYIFKSGIKKSIFTQYKALYKTASKKLKKKEGWPGEVIPSPYL